MTAPPHKTKPAQPLKTKPAAPAKNKGKPFVHKTGPATDRRAPSAIPDDDGLDNYPNRKTLMQRKLSDCCWPITSRAPWFYCGEPVHQGGSYCEKHLHARRDPHRPVGSGKDLIRSVGYLK